MRRGKDASLKALISAMAEAESKSYYEEQENALNDLSGLLKTFLNSRWNLTNHCSGFSLQRLV